MVLEKLGSALNEALRRILRAPVVDETTVKELIHDIQRALLQADVNVQLVLKLSQGIQERVLKEQLPPGISRREHVVKVVYEELTKFLGEKPARLPIETGRTNVIMLVGVQGSGKTTSAAKLARYFRKRGLKTALVCADTFRPGAYAQLKTLAGAAGVSIHEEHKGKEDPVQIAIQEVERFRKEDFDVVIIDTAGRHKDEKALIQEMKEISSIVKPNEIIFVIDATIGQQAAIQAKAFHEATTIGSILVAKLDGSAKGGGAISAVIATGAPIKFIGVGEKIDDLELFDPARFVGRLLGMGDIQSLVEKVKEAELAIPEKKAKAFLSGKLTLEDMYEQLESLQKMGSIQRILAMIPGLGYQLPKTTVEIAEDKMKRWRVIIQSMTKEERKDPKLLNASRIRRIARGAGTSEHDVKELVQQYFAMKRFMKTLARRRLPFLGKIPRDISGF
ncbi:signal recognition particle protein Srp54 [Candidatus Bathyarchaeota archaeon]|nr:signal recognition particle protein Srp54 [Candidatus Bathyarchaeota archaeon]